MPPDHGNRWVALEVLAAALKLAPKRARRVALQEGIRTTPTRPQQYHWGDIVRVARTRQENPR